MPMRMPAPAMWVDGPIVVVDAGPAGLPVAAACLRSRGVPPPLVLDRAGCIASLPQRSDYCRLPGVPFPDHYPEHPTKNLLFAYLQAARFDILSCALFVYIEPYAARFDISPVVPDRADWVASPWPRSIYGLLRLHHRKDFSRLPGIPFPDHYSEHPTRKLLVAYLEAYAARFDIRPVVLDRADCIASQWQRSAYDQLPGKPFSDHYPEHPTMNLLVACRDACVARLDTFDQSAFAVSARFDHAAGLWRVSTILAKHNNASAFKEYIGRWIVVATDDNAEDIVPEFDGAEAIEGPVVDMSGEAYRGNLVAVIGSGEAYCVKREFMLDLCDHNASLSMVIRDSMRGLPRETTFSVAVFVLRFLRLWLVDNFLVVLVSVFLGSLGELGMRPPSNGPQEQKNTKARTPVFDGGVLTRIPSCNIKIVSGIRRSSGAGLRHQSILMFLLITLLAGVASARPVNTSPVCPTYLVQGHVCHIEDDIEALARVPSVPPNPPMSRQVNFGCRYSANILLLLACLAPWHSIWKFQPNDGTYIQFFFWRRRHLHIWKYMAICSIFYYMCIMIYGLALGDSSGMNIFLVNGACGFIFVILLVFLMYRHRNFYEATRVGVAAVGACFTVALVLTFPLHLAIKRSFSPNTIIKIFGILSIPLMMTMHTLRWFPLKISCWFVVFNLFGIASGFLWLCNGDGDIVYEIVILGGAVLRIIEVVTSVVWWCNDGNWLVRQAVHN